MSILQTFLGVLGVRHTQRTNPVPVTDCGGVSSLRQVPPGQAARIRGFCGELSPGVWAHLRAYGVEEDAVVHLVRHRPVTVLQVGELELALDASLARHIWAEPLSPPHE